MEQGRRSGRSVAAVAVAAAAVVTTLSGCGDDTKASFGSEIVSEVGVVELGEAAWNPVDATPSPDGRTVYLTGVGASGPGVFRIPAGGGPVEPLAVGAPFRTPVGVAVSADGSQVFVADPGADAVFAIGVAVAGGKPAPMTGTEGMAPRGVEVVGTTLYFTGRERAARTVGVFTLGLAAANAQPAPAAVVTGGPLVDPDAVTATRSGTVYVSDRGGPGGDGVVYRVAGGSAQRIADLRAPRLAGVTLTLDESTLLVSSLSPAGTDQVLVIDLASNRTGVFSRTIGQNRNGAGLHRAHAVDVFAWADIQRPGRVYVLRA